MKKHDHDNPDLLQRQAAAGRSPAPSLSLAQPSGPVEAATFEHHVNHSPRLVTQRQLLKAAFGPVAQREAPGQDEEVPMQRKAQVLQQPVQHQGFGAAAQLSTPVAQRLIHEWTDGAWVPGKTAREGGKKFPSGVVNDKKFFNDVTGRRSKTRAGASRSLSKLSLEQGSLEDLKLPGEKSGDLVNGDTALQGVNEKLTSAFSEYLSQEDQSVDLGFYSFKYDAQDWAWHPGENSFDIGDGKATISSFLRGLMVANGQMDYIRTRSWYKKMTYTIEVDVNFYMNRRFGDKPFEIHKDTSGANLFVNLVFMNQTPTIGTEVTVDTREMGKEKRKALLQHMPKRQVKSIEKARKKLKDTELAQKIHSKELPKSGYVSWVDELIWHSSPFIGNRPKWDKDGAIKALTTFNAGHDAPRTHEAMALIARIEGSHLSIFMKQYGVTTLTLDEAFDLFNKGYRFGFEKNRRFLTQDIDRVKWGDFKLGEVTGQDQAGGDKLVKDSKTIETPSGLVGRPRTLSDAEEQQKWQIDNSEGRSPKVETSPSDKGKTELPKTPETTGEKQEPKPIKTTGRNFIRTWVRVKENK